MVLFLQRGRQAATLPPGDSTNGSKKGEDEMSEMSVAMVHDDSGKESLERQKEREEEAKMFSEQASVKRTTENLLKSGVTTTLETTNGEDGTVVQQRAVSCLADTSSQREVVVECFAPYNDHK